MIRDNWVASERVFVVPLASRPLASTHTALEAWPRSLGPQDGRFRCEIRFDGGEPCVGEERLRCPMPPDAQEVEVRFVALEEGRLDFSLAFVDPNCVEEHCAM